MDYDTSYHVSQYYSHYGMKTHTLTLFGSITLSMATIVSHQQAVGSWNGNLQYLDEFFFFLNPNLYPADLDEFETLLL